MDVRRAMRGVKGVPLIYVNRSVMILEPMPDATRRVCEGEEKGKLRDGFVRNLRAKTAGEKRKREDEEGSGSEAEGPEEDGAQQDGEKKKKKKKKYGKKEPNPLSVPKSKKKMSAEEKLEDELRQIMKKKKESGEKQDAAEKAEGAEGAEGAKPKRKRRRKHKVAGEGEGAAGGGEGAETGQEAGGQALTETTAPTEAVSQPAPVEGAAV
jgi:U3 small nucleolar RNA-associated protein 23